MIATFCFSCVEEFDPDIEKYENILVIDGLLTNEQTLNRIILSRSYKFDDASAFPESGANVQVIDENSASYSFIEKNPGLYLPEQTDFKGIPGASYKLCIQTADGEIYESDYEKLKYSPEFDTVYYVFEQHETNEVKNTIPGYQFYISTHDDNNNTKFYRYSWNETWEITIPFIKPEYDDRITCWKKDSLTNIIITNTEGYNQDIISNLPLTFVTSDEGRLHIKYCVQILQFALSRNAYKYLEALEQNNENLGSLFDPVPSSIQGNIYNVNNENAPVLGYFMASGVRSKRIFITRDILHEDLPVFSGYEDCRQHALYEQEELFRYQAEGYVFMYWTIDEFNNPYMLLASERRCVDCTLEGTTNKPYFWDYDKK